MTSISRSLSFEFFPTRTPEGRAKQILVRQELKQFNPQFFSCTSGAGGSTREGTLQTVRDILNEQTPAAPPCAPAAQTAQSAIFLLHSRRGRLNA